MRRHRHIALFTLAIAAIASTGLLRVAHDLTSHICSCVSGLVITDPCHESDHECGTLQADKQEAPHNHKHPADESDCDICAVLHAVRHATPLDAPPALIASNAIVQSVREPLRVVYADARALPWSARGPPITL